MAQNFWTAIFAWVACFVVTIGVSLVTRAPEGDLKGLVYSETPRVATANESWLLRPSVLGVAALVAVAILNAMFW